MKFGVGQIICSNTRCRMINISSLGACIDIGNIDNKKNTRIYISYRMPMMFMKFCVKKELLRVSYDALIKWWVISKHNDI